jgi:hypothetical protein
MELRSIHRGGKEKQVGTFLNVGVFFHKRKEKKRVELNTLGINWTIFFPLYFTAPGDSSLTTAVSFVNSF